MAYPNLRVPHSSTLRQHQAPVIGEKPVPVKGLERTGRDFDPEPLGGQV